ncbi:MAG: TonB-dependent receptor [Proteobacteria bacterium]|nr:TonB-dependent receptor [Pseudomonadota bacterium]MDA0993742.1 TonB-dependent receptor [Pseudomonadota bacterium]
MSQAAPRHLSTLEKAIEINLNSGRYGTFAEIGAGQEVVRWFFQAGGAAGTISKSISAYDMQVSDAIYGNCDRYVSRRRLEAMLQYEQDLTRNRLSEVRGSSSSFFSFADTVSARNYAGTNECHAWMGIRFQSTPLADDSMIIIHVRMLDDSNAAQQEALGVIGVNLIYGAYERHQHPEILIASLVDGLSPNRVEIDMVDFSGEAFGRVDNRVMSLHLVQLGLTGAAMFSASGDVLQPSEILRKRPLLLQRGRFRPVTHVNIDILQCAREKFEQICGSDVGEILPIMEMSLHNLMEEGSVCLEDFVSRAEVASSTGCTVMISDFREYHRLTAYLSRYTKQPIGLAMGLATLRSLFEEKYYTDLDGGILESFGRLFKEQVKLLIYPLKNEKNGEIESVNDVVLENSLQHLYGYLLDRQFIVPLENVRIEHLGIHSPGVLNLIENGSDEWTDMVPASVASIIIERKLFGYCNRRKSISSG